MLGDPALFLPIEFLSESFESSDEWGEEGFGSIRLSGIVLVLLSPFSVGEGFTTIGLRFILYVSFGSTSETGFGAIFMGTFALFSFFPFASALCVRGITFFAPFMGIGWKGASNGSSSSSDDWSSLFIRE